jgi:hypothetical protein
MRLRMGIWYPLEASERRRDSGIAVVEYQYAHSFQSAHID